MMMTKIARFLSPVVLAMMLIMAGCDSSDSGMNDGGDDNGDGDASGEISYLIEIGAINAGSATLQFSYECFDEAGAAAGGSGNGTVSAASNSFSTNMCIGFGLVLETTYTEGSSPVDVRVVAGSAGANEGDVLAEQTIDGQGDAATFRLGTAPDS